jgi:hypothetical protein
MAGFNLHSNTHIKKEIIFLNDGHVKKYQFVTLRKDHKLRVTR